MTTKPEGVIGLTEARTAHGPWYTVGRRVGSIEKWSKCPPRWWFDAAYAHGMMGYCFLNYFHALAYSLKVKNAAHKRTG